jgi:ribosomal protein S18 acetylase RimI-like enzyme
MFTLQQLSDWCKHLVLPKNIRPSQSAHAYSERLQTRWLLRSDLKPVAMLDGAVNTRPWCEDLFKQVLTRRDTLGMATTLWDFTTVVGFTIYTLEPRRLEILKLVEDPIVRDLKVATYMLGRLKERLTPNGRTQINVVVDEYDTAGQLFYQSAGFTCTGVVKDYFDTLYERSDGYSFTFSIRPK